MQVTFRVQNAIVSGLKYLHGVRRKGIRVDKVEEMMGSYGPTSLTAAPYERKFPIEEAPSGLLARGTYNVESKFIDDDNVSHGQFEVSLVLCNLLESDSQPVFEHSGLLKSRRSGSKDCEKRKRIN